VSVVRGCTLSLKTSMGADPWWIDLRRGMH
jgi:hypothetical protein